MAEGCPEEHNDEKPKDGRGKSLFSSRAVLISMLAVVLAMLAGLVAALAAWGAVNDVHGGAACLLAALAAGSSVGGMTFLKAADVLDRLVG